jgi:hypothetical protein
MTYKTELPELGGAFDEPVPDPEPLTPEERYDRARGNFTNARGGTAAETWTPPTVPEAVARLITISELAQALLFCHGAFGMPWKDYDGHGTELMNALENPILPHDWEVLRAFVAESQP